MTPLKHQLIRFLTVLRLAARRAAERCGYRAHDMTPPNDTPDGIAAAHPGASARPHATLAQPNTWVVLLVAGIATVVLSGVMLSPWAIVTAFPPAIAKSPEELIAEKLAEKGIAFDAESFQRGQALYMGTCVACHMPDGGPREGLGKDMVHSPFTAGITDKQFLTFLKVGRDPGDPLNTSGVGMPAKGGNPALMDKQLTDIISYIRGLQVKEGVDFE